MRVFVAGATGVLGSILVKKLVKHGHTVSGSSNTASKLQDLERSGAAPVFMDGLDRRSVFEAVAAARPDVIVNEMTNLSNVRSYKNFDREFETTNRLRCEGTAHLLAAGEAHHVKRIVVQSFAGWPSHNTGLRGNPEQAQFETELPVKMNKSQEAIKLMEAMITSSHFPLGIVLRYGHLYGPRTSFARDGNIVSAVRTRSFPLIAQGAAAWSFVHVDDAAEATRLAIENAPGGIYNIVDDKPALVSEWLPELARILEAKPPFTLPIWLAKLLVGQSGLYLMNRACGADNSKARKVLQWTPAFPDWRVGFRRTLM